MENQLDNKNILVVGAGGLLGSNLVRSLLQQGARVFAGDNNVDAMMKRLSSLSLDLKNESLHFLEVDVTDEQSVKKLFSGGIQLDGAVNTSYPRNKTYGAHFFDVSLASFNENISMHLGSAFLFTQQCASYFKRNGSEFSLVNLASIYGVIAPKFGIYANTQMTTPIEYAAIKSAIIHMGKYVSAYVNDSNFRVNTVSPGGIFDCQPESFLESYKLKTNGKGMLDVADVVGTILFLLSPHSRFITGQNIINDDGYSL